MNAAKRHGRDLREAASHTRPPIHKGARKWKQHVDLLQKESKRRKLDVLAGAGDIAEQLIRGEVVNPLPDEIRHCNEDRKARSCRAFSRPKNAPLRAKQKTSDYGREEKDG